MAVKDGLPSTDFSRQNREYIKELIEESGGGGGGLPEITEADEGKFLGVVSGEAAWATAGGGGGGSNIMVVNMTASELAFTLDKTFAEIEAAAGANVYCYVKFVDSDEESGYLEFNIAPINSIIRNPTHGEHEPEFLVEAGSISYTCASENDYPVHAF